MTYDHDDETEVLDPCWRAPDGTLIDRTLEVLTGGCGIKIEDDGSFDYDGSGTEIFWDGAVGKKLAGEWVFLDEAGDEWLESQIIKDPAAPLPDVIVSPWDNRDYVTKLVNEKLAEVLTITGVKTKHMTPEQAARYFDVQRTITTLVIGARAAAEKKAA